LAVFTPEECSLYIIDDTIRKHFDLPSISRRTLLKNFDIKDTVMGHCSRKESQGECREHFAQTNSRTGPKQSFI